MNDTKHRVLIVDDSSFNITILGEALSKEYEISVATNGQDALHIARGTNPPDLILLDIIMPGMDGLEACARLKEDPATRDIPVIFITSMTEEEDETKGLAVGAVDYIAKPFSIPIVKARVKTHVELKLQRDMLHRISTIDGLTGIPNRRRFDEFYSIEWKRARRSATPLTVVMCDIDHFKAYNDTYGHAQGDECLKAVASALLKIVNRPTDIVARYGGEEFVAVLPETNAQGAAFIAEAMRTIVSDQALSHENSGAADHVTISVGVATVLPTTENSPEALLKAADSMLYESKENGRNRVSAMDLG